MTTPSVPGAPRTTTATSAVDAGLRAKEPARIAGMFDAIAPRYDLLNRLLSGGLDQRWRARAIRDLALLPSDVLIDVCTGTADVAIAALASATPPARAVGLDFSREMLRHGLEKARGAAGAGRLTLVQADATRLPLPTASADAATIAFGIRNVQNPEAACRELARVLRPGGRVAILEFGLPRAAWFRRFYLWYAEHALPRIGRLVSRHQSAYAYLPESVGRFPPPDAFGRVLQEAGFPHVTVVPLTLGIVYLFVARKPEGPGPSGPGPADPSGHSGS
jgi:demethylmenaquinone methyltransferase/2-methoxy-6-polyprenyl-1,4-benzoquinol methylase